MTDAVSTRARCELIEELEGLSGQNLGLVTLGGWIVGGQVVEVSRGVAVTGPGTTIAAPLITLGAVNIFSSAFVGGVLTLTGAFNVYTNLKALTAIIRP